MEDIIRKTKNELRRKVHELGTRCSVRRCTKIYEPLTSTDDLVITPEAQQVINRFRNLPEMEHAKNLFDQVSYNN